MPLVTGMEQVIADKQQNDIFAWPAEQNGTVVNVTPKAMVVVYSDGSSDSIEIGRRFGKSKGDTISHDIVAKLAIGAKFAQGDILAYNKGYFTENPILDLCYKTAVLARTALINVAETYEDSCVLSGQLAEKLVTPSIETREILIDFNQTIHRLVTIGQTVAPDDLLCIIEEATTSDSGLLDDDLLDTLKSLGRNAPRAQCSGTVVKTEVRYRGNMDDMSESLSALAQYHNRQLSKLKGDMQRPKITNEVDESFRLKGQNLDTNQLALIVYIEDKQTAGIGDKVIFGNQGKCTIGSVDHSGMQSSDDREIDALFSISSGADRMINSVNIMGTTNTVIHLLTDKIVDIYKGAKHAGK